MKLSKKNFLILTSWFLLFGCQGAPSKFWNSPNTIWVPLASSGSWQTQLVDSEYDDLEGVWERSFVSDADDNKIWVEKWSDGRVALRVSNGDRDICDLAAKIEFYFPDESMIKVFPEITLNQQQFLLYPLAHETSRKLLKSLNQFSSVKLVTDDSCGRERTLNFDITGNHLLSS